MSSLQIREIQGFRISFQRCFKFLDNYKLTSEIELCYDRNAVISHSYFLWRLRLRLWPPERHDAIMPAAITHYLQALKALDLYRKKGGSFPSDRDAFLWGAQGPDFLFYNFRKCSRKRGSLRTYGSKLHSQKPSRTLSVMRQYMDQNPSNGTARSYLLGFLCHYSLDRTAHPYVLYSVKQLKKQFPGRSDSFLHGQIEATLDVIMLRAEMGILPTDFDLKVTVPKNQNTMVEIARLYSFVLEKLFQIGDRYDQIVQAEKDCRLLSGMLNDRTTLKKYILEHIEKLTGKFIVSSYLRGLCEDDVYDYANVTAQDWRWPLENANVRSDTFFQLFEYSVEESSSFMLHFFDCEDYVKMTNEIPFL